MQVKSNELSLLIYFVKKTTSDARSGFLVLPLRYERHIRILRQQNEDNRAFLVESKVDMAGRLSVLETLPRGKDGP